MTKRAFFFEIGAFSVNRRQKDVLPWLPKIVYEKESFLMEIEQQKLYLKILEEWKQKVLKSSLNVTKEEKVVFSLEILAKLKTITLFPKILGCAGNGVKFDYLVSYFKEIEARSIILFSTRSETFLIPLAESLKKEGKEVGLIVGGVSNIKREEVIKKFQSGILKLLFCNIQAAGVGLELSKADTIIFADRSYSPADNEQAEARFLPTTEEKKKVPT